MKNIIYNFIRFSFVVVIILLAIIPSEKIFEIWDTFSEIQRLLVIIVLSIIAMPWFIWLRKKVHEYEDKKRK